MKKYIALNVFIMFMIMGAIAAPIMIDLLLRDANGDVRVLSIFDSPLGVSVDGVSGSGADVAVYVPMTQSVAKVGFMKDVFDVLLNVLDNPQVKFIIAHIVLNFVVAVGVSLYLKTFSVNKLWEVFGKKLLPMVGTYFTFDVVGALVGGDLIPTAVFTAIEAALLADLLHNLNMVPALKPILEYVPDFLKKLVALPPMELVTVEPGTVVDLETANGADK